MLGDLLNRQDLALARKCTAPGDASRVFRHRKRKVARPSRKRISDSEPCGTPHPGKVLVAAISRSRTCRSNLECTESASYSAHMTTGPEASLSGSTRMNATHTSCTTSCSTIFARAETENNRFMLSLDISERLRKGCSSRQGTEIPARPHDVHAFFRQLKWT